MLAKNKISTLEMAREDDIESRLTAVENDIGTTSWWIRGIPNDVRDVAEIVSKNHNMKLSDFIAEAILMYVEQLDSENGTGNDVNDGVACALLKCVGRIEALEKRLKSI